MSVQRSILSVTSSTGGIGVITSDVTLRVKDFDELLEAFDKVLAIADPPEYQLEIHAARERKTIQDARAILKRWKDLRAKQ